MKTQYTIHDVAALLGISADAIRLYEKEGLVKPKRNPNNGYRYYEFEQIHKIMGIALYRQLDVGLAEIKELFVSRTFEEVSRQFSEYIAESEGEIERLQKRTEKLRFMKRHLDSLASGVGRCQIKELPDCYILYHQDSIGLPYREMQKIITSPVFSFGNFCYLLGTEDGRAYKAKALEFLVREPMLALTSWKEEIDILPVHKGGRCIYTVKKAADDKREIWDLTEMWEFAKQQHVTIGHNAYVFYIYSLPNKTKIEDYYEIYLPIFE